MPYPGSLFVSSVGPTSNRTGVICSLGSTDSRITRSTLSVEWSADLRDVWNYYILLVKLMGNASFFIGYGPIYASNIAVNIWETLFLGIDEYCFL